MGWPSRSHNSRSCCRARPARRRAAPPSGSTARGPPPPRRCPDGRRDPWRRTRGRSRGPRVAHAAAMNSARYSSPAMRARITSRTPVRSRQKPSSGAAASHVSTAAEEPGLDVVRPAVLGAEHVAVAAVVAGVGEGGDLCAPRRLHRLRPAHVPAVLVPPGRRARDLAGRQHEHEVGVVRADRHAFVARQAVEQPQLAADLSGRSGVAGAAYRGLAARPAT
jgi:hypothetical protein